VAVGAPFPASAPATRPAIEAQDALGRVKILTNPDMEGRGATTAGLARAADYIAARFAEMKLGGAGDVARGGAPGYFQAVDIPLGRQPAPGTALSLGGEALELGRDFAPSGAAGGARAVAGMVFAGYGIVVPGRYDDYAGIDARGKLVICLRYAPRYDRKNNQAADPAFTDGASLRVKVATALAHGAVAVAIVDPPGDDGADAAATAAIEPLPGLSPAHEAMPAALAAAMSPAGAAPAPEPAPSAGQIASFHLTRAAVDRLLAGSGRTVASLQQKIDGTGDGAGGASHPASFDVPGFADFTVAWRHPSVKSRNVLAVLEGADPVLRGEAVLIGAHYDHLGHGDEGSALGPSGVLFPGADDNASGTAAVLEVAEAFAASRERPKRSVVFAAFTGEERGLFGSMALSASGRAGGKRVVAMINLDMVGRMKGDALEVGGATTAPDWEAIVKGANRENLSLSFPQRVVPNSDHASFLTRQIPSLFLFTGLHGDYHRPTDTWDKINAEGLARTARLAFRVVQAVADRDARLAFVAPQWTRMGSFGGAHGTGVRLGVMPDYQNEDGLRISAVMAGGAAEAAGLRAGDVIVAIGGKPVTNLEVYMERMAELHPGAQTIVRYRRGNDVQEVTVKFPAAPPDGAPAAAGAADKDRRGAGVPAGVRP